MKIKIDKRVVNYDIFDHEIIDLIYEFNVFLLSSEGYKCSLKY